MASASGALAGAGTGAAAGTAVMPGIGTAIGAIGGGLLGLFGGDSPADVAREEWDKLGSLGFTPEALPYLQMQALQNYNIPDELKAQIIQENPQLANLQMQSMNELKQIQEAGFTPTQERAFTTASRAAGTQAQGAEQAILQDMASRGRSGSGVESALRQMAIQAANERASQQMMQQAQAEAEARQRANDALFAQAYQMRGQESNIKGQNADILNRFAEMNSKRRQEAQNANVDLANKVAMQNYQTQQANVENRNAAKRYEMENKIRKAQAMAGQAGNTIDPKFAGIGQMVAQAGSAFDTLRGSQTSSPSATPSMQGSDPFGVGKQGSLLYSNPFGGA